MSHLDLLYEALIAAETREQAAQVLHGAYGTVESMALLEQAVEDTESTREAYDAALAECGEGVREVSSTPALFAGLLR